MDESTSGVTQTLDGQLGSASEAAPIETSQKIPVKLGDQEVEVTLEELQAGYMRQADYTRKTQDLANQRTELQSYIALKEAYDQDPATAHQVMAQFYGLDVQPPARPQADPERDLWDDEDNVSNTRVLDDDPRLVQLQRQYEMLRTNQIQQQIDREAEALAQRYPDADPAEVKRHATVNGFPTLEAAYRDLTWAARDEAYQALQRRKEAEAQVVDEKRKVGVLSRGSGTAVNSVEQPQNTKGMSFADLLRSEMESAGFKTESLTSWGS